jgi:hypothetical protein
MTIWQMKRVALGKSKILLRNGANILKIIIYERFILNFSILGLIFHNLSKKSLNLFTDAVLNLLEVGTVKDKTSKQVTKTFERLWLSRYPQQRTCVHDRGPEIVAHKFQTMLEDTGIGSRPTLAQNPQSNGIVKQVHRMIAAVIRIVIDSLSPIDTVEEANDIVQDTRKSVY